MADYDPNIPQPNDRPSRSQNDILTNFQQLNSIFAENHVTFNDATVANRGKHNFCSFPEQSSLPGTAANELALFSQVVSGVLGLYVRKESGGAAYPIFTSNNPVTPSISPPNFVSYLPGGLILQGTQVTLAASGGFQVFSFPQAFPNGVLGIFVTGIGNATSAYTADLAGNLGGLAYSNSQFSLVSTRPTATTPQFILALGY